MSEAFESILDEIDSYQHGILLAVNPIETAIAYRGDQSFVFIAMALHMLDWLTENGRTNGGAEEELIGWVKSAAKEKSSKQNKGG